jgi:hypothetical protein
MRKFALNLMLASVGAATAHAGSAQKFEIEVQLCTKYAQIGGHHFVAKQKGDTSMMPTDSPDTRQDPYLALAAAVKRYSWTQASSLNDAMRMAAAKCADNIRNVGLNAKSNWSMSENDLR